MTYLIAADVKDVIYYVRILDLKTLEFRLEGLKNNATPFESKEIAEAYLAGLKTKLVLTTVKK